MTGEGSSNSIGTFTGDGDSLGHVVGEASSSEDGEAEEVDLGLSDSAPSHAFTARIIGLDIACVKE